MDSMRVAARSQTKLFVSFFFFFAKTEKWRENEHILYRETTRTESGMERVLCPTLQKRKFANSKMCITRMSTESFEREYLCSSSLSCLCLLSFNTLFILWESDKKKNRHFVSILI